MLKKIADKIWNFSLKKGWDWVWAQTTVDEKAAEIVEEVKERAAVVKEELKDVKDAVKEVVNQAEDVVEAAKGAKRRGRPKKSGKKEA